MAEYAEVYKERIGGLTCAACLREIREGDEAICTEADKGGAGRSYHVCCPTSEGLSPCFDCGPFVPLGAGLCDECLAIRRKRLHAEITKLLEDDAFAREWKASGHSRLRDFLRTRGVWYTRGTAGYSTVGDFLRSVGLIK